jgi:type VI protein secretion system component Hcp
LHASGGKGHPKESFSLNFATVEQEHKIQKADGTAGAANKKKFDVKQHKAA